MQAAPYLGAKNAPSLGASIQNEDNESVVISYLSRSRAWSSSAHTERDSRKAESSQAYKGVQDKDRLWRDLTGGSGAYIS